MSIQASNDIQNILVNERDLTEFTAEIFRATGMPQHQAQLQSEILVWANLRGIDSHGVLRIPAYIERIDAGDMIPGAEPRVATDRFATALIDAFGAPGPTATMAGVNLAVEKAKKFGVAWIVVRDLNHNGALGYYTQKIAAEGLLGMTTVCSPPNMAPFGAKAAGLHNSPISIGIPAGRHHPIILDMATSVAAGGKIYFAADRGLPIPKGWALDAEGNETTDANQAKIWLPFEGPKGSGLAMMFECWSSLLANNPLCSPRIFGRIKPGESFRQNAMVAAIDVGAFCDPQDYARNVDELIESIKGLPRIGENEILVPGEREVGVAAQRARDGILLPKGTIERIDREAKRFGITPPWTL
jgi:ureidoglycolate dehydrogenase (NAD+)